MSSNEHWIDGNIYFEGGFMFELEDHLIHQRFVNNGHVTSFSSNSNVITSTASQSVTNVRLMIRGAEDIDTICNIVFHHIEQLRRN